MNLLAEHNYVNDSVIAANRDSHREPASLFDVFDMRKYYIQILFSNLRKMFVFIITIIRAKL